MIYYVFNDSIVFCFFYVIKFPEIILMGLEMSQHIRIVSRFFRKNNSNRLAVGNQPAMISVSSSSSGLVR